MKRKKKNEEKPTEPKGFLKLHEVDNIHITVMAEGEERKM